MKKLLLASAFLLLTGTVFAAVPNQIVYQGKLKFYSVPANGPQSMFFEIYDDSGTPGHAGTQKWNSGNVSVNVSSGVFSYTMTPTMDWRGGNYWIQLTVNGKTLSPREQITPQVFALHSLEAENIKSNTNAYFVIGQSTCVTVSPSSTTVSSDLNVQGKLKANSGVFFVDGSSLTTANIGYSWDAHGIKAYTNSNFVIGTSTCVTITQSSTTVLNNLVISNSGTGGYLIFPDGSSMNSAVSVGSAGSVANPTNLVLNADASGGDSTSKIQLEINGNEKMRVANSGNVGIGTTNPDQTLSVTGNIDQTGVFISSGTGNNYFAGKIGIGTTNPSAALEVNGMVKADGGIILPDSTTITSANVGSAQNIKSTSTANFVIGTSTCVTVSQSSTTVLNNLVVSGNLQAGSGIIFPDSTVMTSASIGSAQNIQSNTNANFVIGTSTCVTVSQSSTTVSNNLVVAQNNSNTLLTLQEASNNSTGPAIISQKARGTTLTTLTAANQGDTLYEVRLQPYINSQFRDIGDAISVIADGTPGVSYLPTRIQLCTASNSASSTPVMVITSTGAVGIGTTSPSAILEVNGNIKTDTGIIFPDNTTLTSANIVSAQNIQSNTNSNFVIGTSTCVTIIQSTTTISNNLQVSGNEVLGTASSSATLTVNGRIMDKTGFVMPVGTILPYGGTSAPAGWLLCDGTAYSRSTYVDLFSAIGINFGSGNGTSTFNVPDMRGMFLRGLDYVNGIERGLDTDKYRVVGSTQSDMLQGHSHENEYTQTNSPGGGITLEGSGATINGNFPNNFVTISSDGTNGNPRTGKETRPVDVAVNYIIKY